MPAFRGFSSQGVQFLVELTAHNERAWFQGHKADYERLLKEPLVELCEALAGEFAARGIPLRANARSPFRIYRDLRFSADKTPYKTHLSASFPWAGAGGGAGAYFHLAPGEIFAGGGVWHPERAQLAAWRNLVLSNPAAVHEAIDDPAFVAEFGALGGDSLKRAPAGVAPDHPDIELLKLKDVTFGRPLSDDEAFSPRLPETLASVYAAAVPVLRLLAGLADEPVRAGWLREA